MTTTEPVARELDEKEAEKDEGNNVHGRLTSCYLLYIIYSVLSHIVQ